MRIKRLLSMLCAVVMSSGCLVSCGGKDSSSSGNSSNGNSTTSTPSDNSSSTVTTVDPSTAEGKSPADGITKTDFGGATLKVLTHRTDRVAANITDNTVSLESITKAFEKKYNCKVEYQAFTRYASDVSTMMTTSDYGDVLMIPDTVKVSELSNYFIPLGNYEDLDKRYYWANQKMYNDKVYGLAIGGSISGGICYNKETWSAAGIKELPKTPEAFLEDLGKIRDYYNGKGYAYYTNFAAADWTLAQWTALANSASGKANNQNNIMITDTDVFTPGTGYYEAFKLMYDLFSDKSLYESDPNTTDWEGSKNYFGEGRIATMVMGSWAVNQFKEVAKADGNNPDDIGYMPAPFTAKDGKQYAESASDYCMGINKNSSKQDLGKLYIEWYIEQSGIAQGEGYVGTLKGSELPDYLEAFENVEIFISETAPEGLVGAWDAIDKNSEVGFYQGDSANFKIKLAEAAFAGKGEAGFKEIINATNAKWNAARDAVVAGLTAEQKKALGIK